MAETDRNTVLDSLAIFGGVLSLAGAAKKYGVPRGTIGRWVSERKAGRPSGEVVKLVTAAPNAPAPEAPRARRTIAAGEMHGNHGGEFREEFHDLIVHASASLDLIVTTAPKVPVFTLSTEVWRLVSEAVELHGSRKAATVSVLASLCGLCDYRVRSHLICPF